MDTADDLTAQEITLDGYHRLIQEILKGGTRRTVFRPWELETLLDIESCRLEARQRSLRLQQYMRAVRRHMENRRGRPIKFSEFLQRRTRRPSME